MYLEHMLQFFLILLSLTLLTCSYEVRQFSISMPNVRPDGEAYICTPVRVVPDKNYYIVGFEPNATMNTIHHMLLFGCLRPGSNETYWNCGEMASNNEKPRAEPCQGGSFIIYAWARNAPSLKLPTGVGFQVGRDTSIQYLVLQLHYSRPFQVDERDHSGLTLLYTDTQLTKLAGTFLLVTAGVIPPKTITHMESSCTLVEDKVMFPFAYRTHTHGLGRVVSGYKIRRDRSGKDHWTLLGKRDPLTPQMFYPIFDTEPIYPGERLASRCTMDSYERTNLTSVGPTNKDEMCNFYIMYYVETGKPLKTKYCLTEGPPVYSWEKDDLNNIPHDASILEPELDNFLK